MNTQDNGPPGEPSELEAADLREEDVAFDDDTRQEEARELMLRRHAEGIDEDPQRPVLAEVIDRSRQDGHTLIAKRDEVLVRTEDLTPGLVQGLRGYVQDDARSTSDVALFVHRDGPDPDFESRFEAARSGGAKLLPNVLCAASQPKMKGGSGPHPAPRFLPPRGDAAVGAGVVVAVIDTGIWDDAEHRSDGWLDGVPEATDRTNIDPLDVVGNDHLLDLGAGHGTFVAGLIRQVAPGADVVVFRALDTDGVGTDESVALAIEAAAGAQADIIHLSLAGPGFDGEEPPKISSAVAKLPSDTVVVAAAGNEGTRERMFPAAIKRVVAVGALTRVRQRAKWSSYGPWVDVWAVGEGTISTFVNGTTSDRDGAARYRWDGLNPIAMWSGTSYAAPQVTGLIAARMTEEAGRRAPGVRMSASAALAHVRDEAVDVSGVGRVVEPIDFTIEHPRTPDTPQGERL